MRGGQRPPYMFAKLEINSRMSLHDALPETGLEPEPA